MDSEPSPPRRQYPTETLPNAREIAAARRDLRADEEALARLKALEKEALAELEVKKKQIQEQISVYHTRRDAIRENRRQTLSYLAPIRRLPLEIYREIFLASGLSDYTGKIPWTIASVCRIWRKMALDFPNLWSTIRFRGTVLSSPDIIRIWVDRSGNSVPLDIDIEIGRRRTRSSGPRMISSYMRPRHLFDRSSYPDDGTVQRALQWGHVAFYYLLTQKHRWRSFAFESLDVPVEALEYIQGPFPLLEEFRVQCGDHYFRPSSWQWFLCKSNGDATPVLRKLTLDHVNFSWSSPVFRDLTTLRIHSPSQVTYHPNLATLDSVFGILRENPNLQVLSLHLQGLQNSVLPNPDILALPHLRSLSLEGAPQFLTLMQYLKLASLRTVNLKFEVPQSTDFGEKFSDLLRRSDLPAITGMSIQHPYRIHEASLGYFECLEDLEELTVSRIPLEDLLLTLDGPSADGSLICPNLTKLTLQHCPGRRDMDTILPRLINFVDQRTTSATRGLKKKLQVLKIIHCGCIITPDTHNWLKRRLREFKSDEMKLMSITPLDYEVF
ncbi:SubName: Full=Uncharacterized protein {ECO:0000313/EMBL:CCA71137.1} [Serendipita indica DSM 11827]|nr:SubName: Full=Uncharacterized protein {ECO:0000313/EMBL:CCA71137.1} [Serendipita indica DSM 11827]